MGFVALTTDFGSGSPYVAQMKGVILSTNPTSVIVDITHDISPQDVYGAALSLRATAFAFPLGTVHLVVVDPGVGTKRRPIAVQARGMFFVGPDNGVLGNIASLPDSQTVHLTQSEFFRKPISPTFHGRDIFAPVATELSAGLALNQVGVTICDPCTGLLKPVTKTPTHYEGQVMGADSFGNILTNIPGHGVSTRHPLQIRNASIPWVKTYAEANHDQLVALIGSDGYVEIAIRNASATKELTPPLLNTVVVAKRQGTQHGH